MQPIDCEAVVAGWMAAAATAESKTHAARAIDPLEDALRARLLTPRQPDEPVPMLRLIAHPPLKGSEPQPMLAQRLRLRLDELGLAKAFGDATDVQAMVGTILSELRQAALAAV